MKILGHPVHLMLVHFPAALFPMECAVYGLQLFTGNPDFGFASYCVLMGGVAMGWAAAIFGALDMNGIAESNGPVLRKALLHGGINGTVLVAYSAMAYPLYGAFPALPPASTGLFVARALLVLLLVVGNFIGGSLVLQDKVGTNLTK